MSGKVLGTQSTGPVAATLGPVVPTQLSESEAAQPAARFIGNPASPDHLTKGGGLRVDVGGKPIVGAEAFTAADQERWRDHPAPRQSWLPTNCTGRADWVARLCLA